MLKTLLPVAMVLAILLSGCTGDAPERLPDLEKVYGPGSILKDPNITDVPLILVEALEGRFVAPNLNATWAGEAHLVLTPEPVTLPKQDPGPNGGGGVVHALEEISNVTLEVRFANASSLEGYQARFATLTAAMMEGTENVTWGEPMPVSESYRRSAFPGRNYTIVAELVDGNQSHAGTLIPFVASFESVTWTIHSSVRPVRALGQPAPANYDAMADEFTVVGPASGVVPFRGSTVFDGMYSAGDGTDVGIQLLDPDRVVVPIPGGQVCADAGGAGPMGAPNPDPTNVEQAHETMTGLTIGKDMWTIRVGACYGDNYYHNAGMVPYVLTLVVGEA